MQKDKISIAFRGGTKNVLTILPSTNSNMEHVHIAKDEAKLGHLNWVKKKVEPVRPKVVTWLERV